MHSRNTSFWSWFDERGDHPGSRRSRRRAGRRSRAAGIANVAQTIGHRAARVPPAAPLIGGLGSRTALVTLTIYAVLPIMRTTVAGIRQVDQAVVEAGTALGMTSRELLWLVEFPLALPSIIAGIRVATVISVGTATIAAAIGAGGLGEYIFRGLSMVDTTTIFAGAIPAAAIAVAADAGLAWCERRLKRGPITRSVAVAATELRLSCSSSSPPSSRTDRRRRTSRSRTQELHRTDHSRRTRGSSH